MSRPLVTCQCPHCGQPIRGWRESFAQEVTCPLCGKRGRCTPSPEISAPPPVPANEADEPVLDDLVSMGLEENPAPAAPSGWLAEPATAKQREFIRLLGGNPPEDLTKAGAHELIEELKDRKERSSYEADEEFYDDEDDEMETGNLIACPDCGKRISARAASCPSCGCPVAGAPAAAGARVQTVEATGKKWKALQVLGTIAFMAGGALSLAAGQDKGALATGLVMLVGGITVTTFARLAAWWHHG